MADQLRSASTVGFYMVGESGVPLPLGFTRNVSFNKIIEATQEAGIGDLKPRENLLHFFTFRGNMNKSYMLKKPLTQMGVVPTAENYRTFTEPTIYIPDLLTGKLIYAAFKILINNQTYTIAMRQPITEAISFLALNVLDSYELGITI
jgi:hypothetical protein